MKVLILEPTLPAKERIAIAEIENDYKATKEVIGGSFEYLTLDISGNEYDFIFDEEGKFKEDLFPNIGVFDDTQLLDVVIGKVIVSKADDDGRQIDLTDEDILTIKTYFENEEVVLSPCGTELLSYTYK